MLPVFVNGSPVSCVAASLQLVDADTTDFVMFEPNTPLIEFAFIEYGSFAGYAQIVEFTEQDDALTGYRVTEVRYRFFARLLTTGEVVNAADNQR